MVNRYSKYVEECLHRLDRGEDLLDILADYPDHYQNLKSLLLVAMASRSFQVPVPNHTAQRLGKNQMLNEMELLRSQGAFRTSPKIPLGARLLANLVSVYRARVVSRFAPSYRLAMVALVLVMSGGFLTLDAAASSQPGDMLYTLKMSLEKVQLALAFYPESPLTFSDQLVDEMPIEPEKLTARSTNRSLYVLHGITFQLNQDGRPGVAAIAELQTKSSPPSFANAQGDAIKGNDQAGDYPVDDTAESEEKANQGKALGLEKENPGKSLGLEKKPREDKNKDKDKDK